MELPGWVEHALTPIRGIDMPTNEFNAIASAIMRLGEQEGPRLAVTIGRVHARAASKR